MGTTQGLEAERDIVDLSDDDIASVSGGLVPLALAGAIIATGATFSFTIGIFDGIAEKYGN